MQKNVSFNDSYIISFFTGCGIKEQIKESVTGIEKVCWLLEQNIEKSKEDFLNSEDAKSMEFYVKKEQLVNSFDNSQKLVVEAKKVLVLIKELIKKDDSNDSDKVLVYISNIRNYISEINKYNQYPAQRLSILKKAKADVPILLDKASKIVKEMKNISADNVQLLSVNKEVFPIKKDDLEEKISKVKSTVLNIENELQTAINEFSKNDGMDISVFVNSINSINNLEKDIKALVLSNETKLMELNKSYTKILADMKSEHFVIVERVAWDEAYDYPTEHQYTYTPSQIPDELVDEYSKFEETIATYRKGFFDSFDVLIPQNLWNNLKINKDANWHSGDSDAEYYIADIESVYYHKYIIIENNKKIETDFIKVDENVYENNIENLGMALITKPYGFYESETDKNPTPPGLAFVDNPKYGEWKQESNGNSFFHYYGMYSMFNDLTGGNRYSRDYYNDYNSNYRNKKPYYNGGYGTYGERTYSSSNRFSKSTFANKNSSNIKSGNMFKSSSVKNAGASSRARGRSGGGK